MIVDNHMRGDLTLMILRTLGEMGIEAVELCEAIVAAGYGASHSRIRRIQERKREERLLNRSKISEEKHYTRNYQKLLSKLKVQGLLREENKGGTNLFFLTQRGRSKLSVLELQCSRRLPGILYVSSPSECPIIISFDIPERQKRKREWLREVLKRLGLKMVHKSVWVGMVKIPKQLFDDLKELNLLECVEIFEVGKTGTLRYIA